MKQGIQKFGRFLSGMVMPNIGAFIAWGLITALFIEAGWAPNEKLATLVSPMLIYLLPLLIGYTGGKMVHDTRGAVVGAIATMGVIVGADVAMFLGAMAMGPLAGWCMKKIDGAFQDKIPGGFEMLYNNFSAGILGMILAILGYYAIGPICTVINEALGAGVGWLVNHKLLPLTSVLVEPAKVLFLNNAINHGVFTPLGAEQVATAGKSIFFMIESNPGPGLGLLLAYALFGKGSAKASAPGAMIIHFLGGIHEIYFPYVLMHPILILAMIGGGAGGVATLSLLKGGLVGAASPGSIFAELAMTPRGGFVANIAGITVACLVTFLLASLLLKAFVRDEDEDLEASTAKMKQMKAESKGQTVAAPAAVEAAAEKAASLAGVTNIIFACDAGMGSSAMGAAKLRKKLEKAEITGVDVTHSPVDEIPEGAQLIICHEQLQERAKAKRPGVRVIPITDFLNAPEYNELIEELKNSR